MQKNIKTQLGRSMVEMLGVLAIVGILTVGGFGLITKATTSHKVNMVLDEISDLAYKVRIIARDYESTGSGEQNINAYVYNGKAYPDTLEYSESNGFEDEYDVTYNIAYQKVSGALFTITASGLSTEMCMEILGKNWGSISTSGFMGMSYGSETALYNQMGIGDITEKCGDENTISLSFK